MRFLQTHISTPYQLTCINLYTLIFFAEGSTLENVSNIFDYFPTNTICQRIQSDDVLQSLIWEGANHPTSRLPETISIDSIHSLDSKESDLLNCQSINIQTSNPINNIFNDSCPVITNDNICIHLPILQNYQYLMACHLKV